MDSSFSACREQLERCAYQEALSQLSDLARRARTPEEKIVAARVAGVALFPGLELRLLREAVRDPSCPPDGICRLAGHYVSHGRFLLVDEHLAPWLESAEWPVVHRARAHGLVAVAMAARHRYQTADRHLSRAMELLEGAGEETPPDLLYDQLAVPYFAGRWEEVEGGLLKLIARPDATPSVYQLLSRCREHLGNPEGALEALRDGSERYPDHPSLWSLQGGLCWSLNRPDEALAALERFGALLPFQRHQRQTERLRAIIARQVTRLAVPMVRQGRNHCFPACLAMVRSYWGKTDDQREIGAAIMDEGRGTPLYRALKYLEEEGWTTRTFRATVERVKALIDAGIPPVLGLEYSGGAHVQLCIGYDDQHRELILQDPAHPYPGRLRYGDFAELYAHSDFWALAFAPAERAGALTELPEEDDRMIRLAQRFWEALRADDPAGREAAAAALADLERLPVTPGLHLTRLRAWPRAGERETALAAAERLLETFPTYRQIRTEVAEHLNRLGEQTRAAAVVREMVGSRPAGAWMILAEDASRQGLAPEAVARLYRKAVMTDPLSPHLLAEWGREEQRRENYARAEELFAAAYEMEPLPAFAGDLAALMADRGELEGALAAFRQVLRASRRYPWAWWRRGEVHWALGQMRKAVRCLRIAAEQAPEDPHYTLRLSALYEATDREEQAVALLQGSPHLESSAELQNSLAVLHLNQGRFEEAWALAEAAAARFPDETRFPPIAAEALRRMGRGAEARALLAAAVNRMPDDPYLTARLGQLLLNQGDDEAGIAALRQARRLAPEWTAPVEWAVEVAEERGSRPLLTYLDEEAEGREEAALRWTIARLWLAVDPAEAMARAERLLEREGRTAEGLAEYGWVALEARRLTAAEGALQEALRLQPELSRACYGMALLAEEERDAAAYVHWMRRAALSASDPQAARRYADRLGDFLEYQEDWTGLESLLADIEGKVPEGWRTTYLGYAQERQGRHAEALRYYRLAEQVDRRLPWPHFRRVMALLHRGEIEPALAAATASAARFPRDVSLAWAVGHAYMAGGRPEEAARALERALSLDPSSRPVRDSLFELRVDEGWERLAESAAHLPPQPRAEVLVDWAESCLAHDRPGHAHQLFRAAAELDPQSDRALLGLARTALEQGRSEPAWDWTLRVLSRNPSAALEWLRKLRAATPAQMGVGALTRALREMPAAERRARAEVLAQLAETQMLTPAGSWKVALQLCEEALQEDPENLGALRLLAIEHSSRGRHSAVYEMLHPHVERRSVPTWFNDILELYLTAALALNRPRRLHWREQILPRLRHIYHEGQEGLGEALALRRLLSRLEVELGHLASAWHAAPHRDALVSALLVGLYWLRASIRPAAIDPSGGGSAAPLLQRPLYGLSVDAPDSPPPYQTAIRLLGRAAGWGYASPLSWGMAGLLALLQYGVQGSGLPWLALMLSAPLWLQFLLPRLPGVAVRHSGLS
ncbi:MAG: tetratricopeptide repeat protein [Bacillota bacterium]